MNNLPSNLYSPEQVEALIFELETYLGWRRRHATKQKATAQNSNRRSGAIPPVWSSDLEGLLGTPQVSFELGVAKIEAILEEVKSWRDLPVVHLILPVLPPASLKTELVNWLRTEIAPLLLVKFKVNSGLVGGLVIRTDKRIHDFSFRKQLLTNQHLIPEILKRPAAVMTNQTPDQND